MESQSAIPLVGSEQTISTIAHIVGNPEPEQTIAITLLLRHHYSWSDLPSIDEMGNLPPRKRRYLTHEEFEAACGADPNEIARVEQFLQSRGLTVLENDALHRTIKVSGTLQAFSDLFGIDFFHVEDPQGTHRNYSGSIKLPPELASVVDWVFGLDNRPVSTQAARYSLYSDGEHEHVAYTIPEVAAFYNFPQHLDGSGECIGLIEIAGGYYPSDIEAYFKELNIPHPVIKCVGENNPGQNVVADMEVTLDLEVAASAAPGAQIVVYFAEENSSQSLYRVLSRAIHDSEHRPTVLSVSWSSPETEILQGEIEQLKDLFLEAALMGITICVASGDSGACWPNGNGPFSAPPVTGFPASSPYVLGCGGTTLVARNNAVEREVVWNSLSETLEVIIDSGNGKPPVVSLGNGGASGGGVSSRIDLPSYQQKANVPKAVRTKWQDGALSKPESFRGRGVPDVAGNADLDSGYKIIFNGKKIIGGGTSAVAPLWAGLIARINQGLGCRSGFLNPLLYRLELEENAGIFRAITCGNNGAYEASPAHRWNPCTGLGTPDGQKLLDALQ